MNKLNHHKETAHSEGISYIKDLPPIILPVRYVYLLHQRPAANRLNYQVRLDRASVGTFTLAKREREVTSLKDGNFLVLVLFVLAKLSQEL